MLSKKLVIQILLQRWERKDHSGQEINKLAKCSPISRLSGPQSLIWRAQEDPGAANSAFPRVGLGTFHASAKLRPKAKRKRCREATPGSSAQG